MCQILFSQRILQAIRRQAKPASRRRSRGSLDYPIRQSFIRAAPAFLATLVLNSERLAGGAITVLGLVGPHGDLAN